jgi:hypothetical protein
VDLIQESHLYDEAVVPLVVQWLTAMSTSDVRALRHTSTFLALKLLTKFCHIIAKVSESLSLFNRQSQASQKKTPKKGDKASELTERQAFLKSQIDSLYTGLVPLSGFSPFQSVWKFIFFSWFWFDICLEFL